ncbi:amino acid racemase [Jatrophihabitans sp.]|uniref:aspartate/glutamate racemase family protein n=1 Tax=Jatrophihabitans sp. TaxID=1932789 RepID=UPI0030C7454E|nr:aspartate racemase [Jatrophihabitans sp.]
MCELHRLGLLGGMTWQSTASYYRLLNEAVHDRVGGSASAPVTIHSVDFGDFEPRQRAGDWAGQGRILAEAAAALQAGGAETIALATNTLHLVADQIRAAITVPFVDLVDVVAEAVAEYATVGLLATNYTMTSDMYPKRMADFGTQVIVPEAAEREIVHNVIYDELQVGVISERSREAYRAIMAGLVARGAEAIVLACTEIGLLVDDSDASVPVYDTTALHCAVLTDYMIPGALA